MILLLNYVPHVVVYVNDLLQREHYQFFPLAWLGAAYLLWTRREALRPRADVAVPALGWAGVIAAALMLAAAGVLKSPWLGMASVVPLALGWAWLVGGWGAIKGIGPALVLFATTLRPPGSYDTELIGNLRALAVRISSRLLDEVGVIHVPWRNVIRVPGGDLLVDEACSGINSLVSIMAVVLFLGLLLRRRPLHLVLLLAGSAGIVVLANVMRVSLVTIAYTRWEVDLLHGWKHDALGVSLYAVSLGLAASLDQLLLLLGSLIPRWPSRSSRLGRDYVYGEQGQSWGPTEPASPDGLPPSRPMEGSLPPRIQRLRRRWLMPAILVFALVALITPIRWAYAAMAPWRDPRDRPALVATALDLTRHAQATISEESLPRELAGWERIGFKTEEREPDNPFGMHSSTWTYRLGDREATVSFDYPFAGWHRLLHCYAGIEWAPRDEDISSSPLDSGADMPYMTVSLDRPDGQFAALRFALVDDRGRWVDPPSKAMEDRKLPWQLTQDRPTYQVQAFCPSYIPLGEEQQRQLNQLFEASCRVLHEQLFSAGAIRP